MFSAIIFFNLLLGVFGFQAQIPLNVSVYYEALCPDSIRFITKQLQPNLKGLESFVNVELVPFGKAKIGREKGEWIFHCQHGPNECYGNKVHSCALDLYIPSKAADFISCTMSSGDYDYSEETIKKCAVATDINLKYMNRCLSSKIADKLLYKNGHKTNALKPKINYVPTIIFNKEYSDTLQFKAERDFLKTACELLGDKPIACDENEEDYDL